MKTIFLLLLMINTSYSELKGKDTCRHKEAEALKAELQSFIDSIKPNSPIRSKHAVFIANLFDIRPLDSTFCFTLGYILNDDEVKYISPEYVYYFNDEIVLIRGAPITTDIICKLMLKEITHDDSIRISNKLFPAKNGGLTYTAQGLVFCKEKEKIIRNFYRNSDEIPLDYSIYGNFPLFCPPN